MGAQPRKPPTRQARKAPAAAGEPFPGAMGVESIEGRLASLFLRLSSAASKVKVLDPLPGLCFLNLSGLETAVDPVLPVNTPKA